MTLQHDFGTQIIPGLNGSTGMGANSAALIEPQALPDIANAQSLVVIDTRVAAFETLAAGIENADVVFLDAHHDGVGQITELLTQYQDLASLHIFSHGNAGQLQLGSATLSTTTLSQYADALTQWQGALTDEADILLYGCDVAETAAGQAFVAQLQQLTGADIAASTDLTGNAALGGDWQLEYTQGDIEAEAVLSAELQASYHSTLNTPIRYELETGWNLSGFGTQNYTFASAQQTITLTESTGTATRAFDQPAGTYDITVGFFDEADGVTSAQFKIFDPTDLSTPTFASNWQFDQSGGGNVPQAGNFRTVTLGTNVALNLNDQLEILADQNVEEYARIDYIEFTPVNVPQPGAGTLSFAEASYQVNEGTSQMLVTVERTGGSTGAVSAEIAVTGGDAQVGGSGSDVNLTFPATVTLAAGVVQQTFAIPIVDDSLDEATETLELSLASPTNGATIGSQGSTTLSIIDNDDPAPPAGSPIRYEVEDWTLTNFNPESRSYASNQETVRLSAKDVTGSATTTFTGPAGQYTIKVGFYDENDGVVDAQFEINGQPLSNWLFDLAGSDNVPSTNNFREVILGTDVTLTPGDELKIIAEQDIEEYGRIDYIELVPTGGTSQPGTLAFTNATYQVNEGSTELLVTVERTGGSAGEVSAEVTVTGGDAQTGTASDDVNLAFPITVTLADGVVQQTLAIPIVDDSLEEATETLELSLASPTNGATIGSQASTTLSIIDNDDPAPPAGSPIRSEVEDWTLTNFSPEAWSFASNQETIRITADSGSATQTFDGPNGDYTIVVGFFDEADGVVDAHFEINGQILSTWQFDSNAGGGTPSTSNFREVTLGTNVALNLGDTLTIVTDQDVEEYARIDYIDFIPAGSAQPAGTLSFAEATYQVNEGTSELLVTVERTGGSAGAVSADITVVGGDATGSDIGVSFPITVTLADGIAQQTFAIPIIDDSVDELTETLQLSLASPTNGATLGGLSNTTVSIIDNDAPTPPAGEPIRYEVEDWTLSNFERESRSFASNQETIRITADSGSATTTFNGPAGQYTIEVGFFDENDGVVEAQFEINGQVLNTWQFDAPGNDNAPTVNNFRTLTLGTDIALTPGDVLKLIADKDIEEYARIDYIDFIPTDGGPTGNGNADLVGVFADADNDYLIGGQTDFTFRIQNQGTESVGTFSVDVRYSDDQILGNGGELTLERVTIEGGLAANETIERTVSLNLSTRLLNARAQGDEDHPGAPAGTADGFGDYIGIVIDPDNEISESDESNNAASSTATLGQDLDKITHHPWDVNGDGQVSQADIDDLLFLAGQSVAYDDESVFGYPIDYGYAVGAGLDFDGDNVITAADGAIIANYLGHFRDPGVSDGNPSIPLAVTLALQSDTGGSTSDRMTSDPTISGQLSNSTGITTLQARLGKSGAYTDILSSLEADGSFTLTLEQLRTLNGGSLPANGYAVDVVAKNSSGAIDFSTLFFHYDADHDGGGSGEPLELVLALSNDTGSSDSDRLTSDPTISGQFSDSNDITTLQARIGDGSYVDISDTLQADGSFTLITARLHQLNGGSLPDGPYVVEIQAQDAAGNTGTTTLDFTYTAPVNVPPVDITSALNNDTGENDNDNVSADPTVSGQLAHVSSIVSLQARIGSGAYVDVSNALQADGSFTLDLEQLSELNDGNLPYGQYTVEIQAQNISGMVDTTTVNFNYEFQPVETLYSEAELVPLSFEPGSATAQFRLPDAATPIGGGGQLVAYLVDTRNPEQNLLSNGGASTPILAVTDDYRNFNTSLIDVAGNVATLDLSGLTTEELANAALFFEIFTPTPPSPDPDPGTGNSNGRSILDYVINRSSGSVSGGGASGGGSRGGSRPRFRRSRSGGNGGGNGGGNESLNLLTSVEGDGFTVTYTRPTGEDNYTALKEVKFGENTLTLEYDDNGNLTGNNNQDLLEVILESIEVINPYGWDSDDILEVRSVDPRSTEASTISDIWSGIGKVALNPNETINLTGQNLEKELLDFQENLLKESKVALFDYYRDPDFDAEQAADFAVKTKQLGLDLRANEDNLLNFIDLHPAEELDFSKFSREAIRLALGETGTVDPDSELAWLGAIVYAETWATGIDSSNMYGIAKTILNRAEVIQSGSDASFAQQFGNPLNGSIIKGLVSSHNADTLVYSSYGNYFFNEYLSGITDGFEADSGYDIARRAQKALTLALMIDDTLDMADDDRNDGILKFEKTIVDAEAPIERVKYFDLPDNYQQFNSFEISEDSAFYFQEDESGQLLTEIRFDEDTDFSDLIDDFDDDGVQELRIVFSPDEVDKEEAVLSIDEIRAYDLEGNGIAKQKIFFDQEQLSSRLAEWYKGTLEDPASFPPSFWSTLTEEDEALEQFFNAQYGTEGRTGENQADLVAEFIIDTAIKGAKALLSPFSAGLEILDSYEFEDPTDVDVIVVMEDNPIDLNVDEEAIVGTAAASAKFPMINFDGIDDQNDGREVIRLNDNLERDDHYSARRAANLKVNGDEFDPALTVEQQIYILSKALNFEPGGFALQNLFSDSNPNLGLRYTITARTTIQNIAALYVHEIGHLLGLRHTGTTFGEDRTVYGAIDSSQDPKVQAAEVDVMFQGLSIPADHSLQMSPDGTVSWENLEAFFGLTKGAFQIALGLPEPEIDGKALLTDAKVSLDYIHAYYSGEQF